MAARKTKSKAVAKKSTKSTAVSKHDDVYAQHGGRGQEDMSRDDYAIPRILLLQATHDFCKKQKPEYIEDAEVGDFIFLPEQEITSGDTGFEFVPAYHRRTIIEIDPKDQGKFIREVGLEWAQNGYEPASGNEFVPSVDYYGLILFEEKEPMPALIRMKSTQLKKASQWNTRFQLGKVRTADGRMVPPPIWKHSYRMTTQPEANDKGDWFGWVIEPESEVLIDHGEEVFFMAAELNEAISGDAAKYAAAANAASQSDEM